LDGQLDMARPAGIRFRQAGKIFYYDAGDLELHSSAYVVVETAHGMAVGRVVIAPDQFVATEGINENDIKPIVRLATEEDVEQNEAMQARAAEALGEAKRKAGEMGLEMSINGGEFDLDGSQFTAYFTANERVDFRNLVRDLSHDLDARVQLLQVGDRDRAKLVDGIDICGERLCCSSWMTNFPAVSIRMAKEQDLPLNPQKISGVCGRLYCCLTFEYEDYKALRGTLPKVGSFLSTPAGEAKVTGIDFNREMVKLWLVDHREQVEVAAIDFQLQHGVTIRPMELVRKIEGGMRTLFEDGQAHTSAPPRRERPPRGVETPRPGGGDRPERPPRPERPSRPEGSGPPGQRGPRPERGRRPERPPRGDQAAAPQPAPAPRPAQPTASTGDSVTEGERKRRRRRGRRRGAGGGGGNAPGGDAPATDSSAE
jgi:cell fate regulator YaaT (PSP1 superfamily)